MSYRGNLGRALSQSYPIEAGIASSFFVISVIPVAAVHSGVLGWRSVIIEKPCSRTVRD